MAESVQQRCSTQQGDDMKSGEIAKIKKGYKFGGHLCRIVKANEDTVVVNFQRWNRGATKDHTIELPKEAIE